MSLPASPASKSLSIAIGVLSLLAVTTGCSSEKPNVGRMLGLRPSVSNTASLVADRVELTAYDPHNHTASAPRLMQTSDPRQPRR